MRVAAVIHIIAITAQEGRSIHMEKLRRDIIKMIQVIDDLGTLRIIYHFIRGIKSSH